MLGLLIGLLVFGSTGYLVGVTSVAGSAEASDGSRDGRQERNRLIVGPLLLPLASSWLPLIDGCRSSSEAGGPPPQPGEQVRVRCSAGGSIDVFFVQFRSTGDRDSARQARATQNGASARIAAGAAPVAAQRAGNYTEFAYQFDGRTYGGIYWDEDKDDETTATGAYLEKVWSDGDGGWRPLRDLWNTYA